MKRARALWLGRRPYAPVHALQSRLLEARRDGSLTTDVVLLLEHDPVITLGRAAKRENVLFTAAALAERGVDLVETGRGGDVTYHGPGQLVGYPILDLKPDRCDLRRYVRSLCELMVLIARDSHIEAGPVDGMVGVWVDLESPDRWATAAWARQLAKLGAVGVRVSRWVTMHGFALNLEVDLQHFDLIVPCGIREHPVTSIAACLASLPTLDLTAPTVRQVALGLAPHIARALDLHTDAIEDVSSASIDELNAFLLEDVAA